MTRSTGSGPAASLRETIGRLAPGTPLRDGLERILRGRTGALIVLGYDDRVEAIPPSKAQVSMTLAELDALSDTELLDFTTLSRVRRFGSLQGLLAASTTDLQSVDGIGAMWARQVREGFSQLAESTIADRLL